ncbi:REP13E12 repeat-containing protein [Mycobacterium tuberculosis]|nr:REP13E12 repeat-containing protein [Mycobacterium tuberculosis]
MDVSTRQAAEADLAGKAAQYRPDELARYAQRVMDWLHPDGDLTDTERARKRGITLSNQQYDGMSRLSGYLTPQARATFEAVLAKLAAPGATNPDDHTPVIDTTPDAAAIDRDTRSQAQRNHDGLLAGLRALIASGKLGQHNGLPVSIVVTTTLTDLQTGAGKGFTGGGTLLPMADVTRMTSHAHHYSPASGRYPQAIFDHGTPLALYHTKRLASPAQRIMLFANDRGCTKPGCDAPAYQQPSPPRHRLDQHRTHRHHRADPGLRPRQPTRRKRLDHPQQHPRPHRMATTTPPRPRPTPHQHLPPPRTIPPQPRRRRRTRPPAVKATRHNAAQP